MTGRCLLGGFDNPLLVLFRSSANAQLFVVRGGFGRRLHLRDLGVDPGQPSFNFFQPARGIFARLFGDFHGFQDGLGPGTERRRHLGAPEPDNQRGDDREINDDEDPIRGPDANSQELCDGPNGR